MMKQLQWAGVIALCLALLVALAACSGAPQVSWEVEVTGAVSQPLTLSYSELSKMPQTDLKDLLMQKSRGEDETHSYTGVSLADILNKAEASDFTIITVTAADGYAIEISKDEMAGGIIALKEDGSWIAVKDKEHGPIRLVCPQTPANRWVFQLKQIEVK